MDPATQDVIDWTNQVERSLDAGEPESALEHYMKDVPPEIIGEMRGGPIWDQMVEQGESLRPDAQSLRWAYEAPYADLFGQSLGERGVRLQALYGAETVPEMPAAAAALAAAVPGGEHAEIAGSWHDWEPHAMAEALASFARPLGPG